MARRGTTRSPWAVLLVAVNAAAVLLILASLGAMAIVLYARLPDLGIASGRVQQETMFKAGFVLLGGGTFVSAANFAIAIVRPLLHSMRGEKPGTSRHVSMIPVLGTLFLGNSAYAFYLVGKAGWMWAAILAAALDCGGLGLVVWVPIAMACDRWKSRQKNGNATKPGPEP